MTYVDYKELRVGNWVHNGKDFTISAQAIWEMSRGAMQVQPIELTPEILERLGFKRSEVTTKSFEWNNEYTSVYYSFELRAMSSLSLREHDEGWVVENIRAGKTIKYVHQLQNLFYAISGQELTLSAPVEK